MAGRRKLPPSPLERLDLMPPFLAWTLARDGTRNKQRHLTPEQAAADAGLSVRTFERIASKVSWESVKVGDVDRFLKACRIQFSNFHRQHQFIKDQARRGKFRILKAGQHAWFKRKMKEWAERKAKLSATP